MAGRVWLGPRRLQFCCLRVRECGSSGASAKSQPQNQMQLTSVSQPSLYPSTTANILYFTSISLSLPHTHTQHTQTAFPLWKWQVIVCLHCLVYFIISFRLRFIYNTAYISLELSSWGVLFILQLLINHFRGRVSGADGGPSLPTPWPLTAPFN